LFIDDVVRQLTDELKRTLGDERYFSLYSELWSQAGSQFASEEWPYFRVLIGDELADQLVRRLCGEPEWEVERPAELLAESLWNNLSSAISPFLDGWALAYSTSVPALAGLATPAWLDQLCSVSRAAEWFWPMTGAVVLTDRPTLIRRDGQGRLHRDDGPALAYADGFAVHAWHGLQVPAALIEDGWSVEQIMREPDVAIRRCAIERMGWEQFVTTTGLTQIDHCVDPANSGRQLRLYDAPPTLLDEPVRILLCTNVTAERDATRHTFGLVVPIDCDTALAAATWMPSPTEGEYGQPGGAT
jgi:hypothetical protein